MRKPRIEALIKHNENVMDKSLEHREISSHNKKLYYFFITIL